MENKSLFQKLSEKLGLDKLRESCTVKKVVNGLCAIGLSLTMLFSTGCSCQETNNNNGIINSGQTNNGGGNQQGNNHQNPYKEHSQILQTVLTDNNYTWLIQEAESDKKNDDHSYMHSNQYKAIPYGFLEDEGFDVEAIKNNQLKCETEAFILSDEKNSLYLVCRVENKSSINYYTHFVIKYELTDQELKDLNLVYKDVAQGYNSSYQAPFFIQELSNQKEAIKLSESNITKESEQEAEKLIGKKEFRNIDLSMFGNTVSVTYVKEKIEEDGFTPSFTFAFFNQSNSNSTISSKKISQITITGDASSLVNIDGDKVYTGLVPTFILSRYKTQVEDSLKTAKFYDRGTAGLVNMLDSEFSSYFELNK